jgi:hypothetical protein
MPGLHRLVSELYQLRASIFTIALTVLLIGCCMGSVAGQGVTAGYTVYVSFFYPFHVLYNLQVTIRDQTGRVVATGISYDGSMVTIPVRTETTTIWLTASALGYASGPLTYIYPASPSFWPIYGSSTVPVQSDGGFYWITVNLSQ